MLYLIGGPSRAGKSVLARRLLLEAGVPYFSLDFLVMALRAGFPEIDVSSDHPDSELAERLWPLIKPMCTNIVEVGETYTIEGAYLLPGQTKELLAKYPSKVRAVFLGYSETDSDTKLEAVRAARGMPNDWLQDLPDAMLGELVQRGIHESVQIRKECLADGLPYFETSREFDSQLRGAANFLLQS